MHEGIARQQADSSLCQEPQAVVIGVQAMQLRWKSASLDGNVDNPSEDGKEDEDADANGDTDNGDGLWSCEFVVPTIVITEP